MSIFPIKTKLSLAYSRNLILSLLLITAVFLTSCHGFMDRLTVSILTEPSFETDHFIETSLSEESSNETTAMTTKLRDTTALTKSQPSIDFSNPPQTFDQQIRNLILDGLQKRQRHISLDSALNDWLILEDQTQELIDYIYTIFNRIYLSHPEYFYLDGSLHVSYTISGSANGSITGLTLEPVYAPGLEDLSDDELEKMIEAVFSVVADAANQIRAQSSDPVEQIILLHDWLIQHITCDSSGHLENNHAGSALLHQVSLCKGYAQSFQLIGQALGLEVYLITGQSNGIGHAWNQVVLNGIAYHIDVTHDDPVPDTRPDRPIRHVHLFRSDAVFRITHQWEQDQARPCPEDGAFYYRINGLVAQDENELQKQLDLFIERIHLNDDAVFQLELLYEGQNLPDQASIERLVIHALRKKETERRIYFGVAIEKKVILIQIGRNL